jgi:peptidoglycan-associated lipoprotein
MVSLMLALLLGMGGCKKDAPVVALPEPPKVEPLPEPPKVEPPPEVKEMAANFERVFFGFDDFVLDGSSKQALSRNAEIMKQVGDLKVEVQGHADERGGTEYNLALGERRANAVRSYMSSLGVSDTRVTPISFGEEKPLDSSHTEVAWSQNRRAEFRISYGGRASIQGTTP